MTILQLLNIVLFWLFFGFLASYLARKRGRSPILWFFIGLIFGVLGVVLAVIFPANLFQKKAKSPPPKPVIPHRNEAWTKMWYYLDPSHNSQGPIEFPDLAKTYKNRGISDKSYIWGEGMKEWKKLSDLPDIKHELESH